MTSTAFVDTTVLTDALLKSDSAPGQAARAALARYAETQLPVYAIKEFRAGPFGNLMWLYNKIASERDLGRGYAAIAAVRRRPYLVATSLQGLESILSSLRKTTLAELNKQYGQEVSFTEIQADQYRLELKRKLYSMWRRRRKVTTHVVGELSCFPERGPEEKRGLLERGRRGCPAGVDCCMRPELIARPRDLQRLRDVARSGVDPEHQRRYRALRELLRNSKRPLHDDACRALGDAVFAFFAPPGAVILTTNLKDHEPLATSLGKAASTP